MANRFFLNALRTDDRSLPTPNTGAWKDDGQGKDFLAKYAADIHLEGQLKDARLAHSVPSVYARPIIFYDRRATCWQPRVKGLTLMVNSLFNGWRMEDLWLDN